MKEIEPKFDVKLKSNYNEIINLKKDVIEQILIISNLNNEIENYRKSIKV